MPYGQVFQDLWTRTALVTTLFIHRALQLISEDTADVLAELSHGAGCGCHVAQLIETSDELPSSHIDKLW